jgi:hypothetical protein
LTRNLGELHAKTGETGFSCVIRAEYDGLDVTASELAVSPIVW